MKQLLPFSSLLAFTSLLSLVGCAAAVPPAKVVVPADLASVESLAEGAYDAALASDYVKVDAVATEASATWQRYASSAAKDGVPAARITAVTAALALIKERAAANASPTEVARACNEISAPMAQIYFVYKPTVPVDALDLDYMGREVLLDARESNTVRVSADLEKLAAVWIAFKPRVTAVGASAAGVQLDEVITQARANIAAKDYATLEKSIKRELEIVDDIEKAFEAQPADAD
jgi:hypothetical protein